MSESHAIDYRITGGGTVYLVIPQNPDAKENLHKNVSDEAQWLGVGLAVEHGYIVPLMEQLIAEGWAVGQ